MSRRRLPSLRLTAAKKGRGKDPTEEEEVAVEKEKEGEEREEEAEEEGGKPPGYVAAHPSFDVSPIMKRSIGEGGQT